MQNQLNQMKQNASSNALNALNLLSGNQGCINPLSASDPLYDAPPATPIYTKSEDLDSGSLLDQSFNSFTPSNSFSSISSSSSNSSGRSPSPKSDCAFGLNKINSEDLLNFQASTEAQAFMLNTLNQLGPGDISDRLAAMGTLFGFDDYNFNLKQFTQLGNIGSISPISCNL